MDSRLRGNDKYLIRYFTHDTTLVLVDIPEEVIGRRSRDGLDRIEDFFEPAIANGLIRITRIELTNDEAESCMREEA